MRLSSESGGEPETVAWLLLGPRPDGTFFSKDEREALEHVAAPLARAVQVAMRRQERERTIEGRLQAIEARIAKLIDGAGGRGRIAALKEGRV